jgi:uncharacterized protein YkwD
MRWRPGTWLAPVAVVALLGGAAAGVVHAHQQQPASNAGRTPSRGAVTGQNDTDIVPSNAIRTAPRSSPSAAPVAVAPPAAAQGIHPPAAVIANGSYQQALINRDRAAAGLPPLTWSKCLAPIAVSNAVRLSRQGWVQPYHTNGASLDLGCHLGAQAGENVGYWSAGVNDGQLNTMFMNSPDHRANILGPYQYVATAWAVGANGVAYVAVEFG